MATQIRLSSGSILNGNPITISVTPNNIENASVHRIIIEVECGISGGNYEVIKLSSPVVVEGMAQTIDISSALRTFRDSYEYTPNPTTYPIVKCNVKAYDEYMSGGEVHTNVGVVFLPVDPASLPEVRRDEAYMRTIFGAFSDMERMTSGETRGVRTLSRKPASLPQLVAVGETFAYTAPYDAEQLLPGNTLEPPTSRVVNVTKEGAQTLGYQSVFALPAVNKNKRQVFRFINGFGVLESVSVPRGYNKTWKATATPFVVSRQETFNAFSRSAVSKSGNRESWTFTTDPMDEAWMRWYLHEFLMSEHVWIDINGTFVSCSIIPDEDITFYDSNRKEGYQVSFTAELDITGSPIL